jgi:fatty acid-binding protein DegV
MDYDSRSPSSRVSAASAVLGNLLKLRELVTLQDRVTALEAALLSREVKP